jgi:hypothetical protein
MKKLIIMTNLNRREVLKQFVFVSAGFALIPSCMQDRSKSNVLLKKIKVMPDDEAMLSELCETIIPKTDTPGAKDISAHLFVLKMVDDCRTKAEQERFMRGMKDFNQFCNATSGDGFVDCSLEQRGKIVDEIISKKDQDTDLIAFFTTVKSLAIQSYTSSQFFLTNVQVYELVPGRYQGCVSI